jgi:hypothetical protein
MASWLNDIRTSLGNLGGVAHYEALYPEIARIRPGPLPSSWKQIVQRTIQDHAPESDGYRGTPVFYSVDGIGSGVWGLNDQLHQTPHALDVQEPEVPYRVHQDVYRILRDTELARKLKAIYRNRCQICSLALTLPDGTAYSEGHHVQPLGQPHGGPDIAANILVLCPNHHVLMDYGAIELDPKILRFEHGHRLDAKYVEYHNNVLRRRGAP